MKSLETVALQMLYLQINRESFRTMKSGLNLQMKRKYISTKIEGKNLWISTILVVISTDSFILTERRSFGLKVLQK